MLVGPPAGDIPPEETRAMTAATSAAVSSGYRGDPLTGSTSTVPVTPRAASVRFSAARSSCSAADAPSTRLPYNALNAVQPSRSPMAATTGMLSRNSADRAGQETRPRSPPGMSPAKKFSPTSATPASCTAVTNLSTSASVGTATANGHQNSTASNPAALAAAGRWSRGNSVNRIEQLTSYLSE